MSILSEQLVEGHGGLQLSVVVAGGICGLDCGFEELAAVEVAGFGRDVLSE